MSAAKRKAFEELNSNIDITRSEPAKKRNRNDSVKFVYMLMRIQKSVKLKLLN